MNAYQNLLDNKKYTDIFGTNTPTIEQRSKYFLDLWLEWKENKLTYENANDKHHIRKCLKELGYNEFWDFQIRFKEVRFAAKDSLAIAKLNGIL